MDDKTQKERLEQELRFLKESFEAEVISEEEFKKGKDRIERKLKEIESIVKSPPNEEPKAEAAENQVKEELKSEAIESKEEKIKLKVIQDEAQQFKQQPPPKIEEKVSREAEKEPEIEVKLEQNKFFKYSIIFVVLMLVIFFSYNLLKNDAKVQKSGAIKFVPVCSSNADCKQEGKEGFCLNPGTVDAKCEFKEIPKTNVVIVNDRKNCFNCDTQRVLSILETWFGAIKPKEIDYSTSEGKALAEKFGGLLLPIYILDENITRKAGFEQFKQAFVQKEGNYVLSEYASAAAFYFKRSTVPNKLDLFVIEGDSVSEKAENNLKEFLENFKDVRFDKHNSKSELAQELGIKNYPAFLMNNQVRFSGVQSAESIKENFCKLNKLDACEKILSKSLV